MPSYTRFAASSYVPEGAVMHTLSSQAPAELRHNTAYCGAVTFVRGNLLGPLLHKLPLILGLWRYGILFATLSTSVYAADIAGPQRIQANSNTAPAGTLANGVLTIDLEVREGEWSPEDERGPSVRVFALAERGKAAEVPGPMIRVPQGTSIHASVHNLLTTAVVMHGMHARPGKNSDVLSIPASEIREVTFLAGEPGAYYYWATAGGDMWNGRPYKADSQLSGAFLVDPAGDVPPDRVFVIGLWRDRPDPGESLDIPVINGKSWPHTERLEYQAGAEVRWRWLNVSAQVHPMHMHGSYFRVDAVGDAEHDGILSPGRRRLVVTELLPGGGTMTTYWHPENPGRWLFHCHILTHVSPETAFLRHNASMAHSGITADDPLHDMAGLVMGITILPRAGDLQAKPLTPRQHLELVIGDQQGGPSSRGYALSQAGRTVSGFHAPGPALVLTKGEPVAIRVTNRLSEPTAVHWHGIELESYYDGVAGWAGYGKQVTPMIQPGSSFDVYFTPPRAGTFIYHTHMNDLPQLSSGLYGPIIVLEPGEKFHPESDKIFIISRNGKRKDGVPLLNGLASPKPQLWRAGIDYRLRLININANNMVSVSLTQNGVPLSWKPVAKDGADLPAEQAIAGPASLLIAPGETYDFQLRPEQAGEMKIELNVPRSGEKMTQSIRLENAEPETAK